MGTLSINSQDGAAATALKQAYNSLLQGIENIRPGQSTGLVNGQTVNYNVTIDPVTGDKTVVSSLVNADGSTTTNSETLGADSSIVSTTDTVFPPGSGKNHVMYTQTFQPNTQGFGATDMVYSYSSNDGPPGVTSVSVNNDGTVSGPASVYTQGSAAASSDNPAFTAAAQSGAPGAAQALSSFLGFVNGGA